MLQFESDSIVQTQNGIEKHWSIPMLLESHQPLLGESLPERNAAMQKVVAMAEDHFAELSAAARLRYDFWKQLIPQRIEEEHFAYEVKISEIYRWELTINSVGVFYQDISRLYSPAAGTVYEQLLSDFWFYGPLMPLPDLHTRKWLVAKIRNAFMQAGSSAAYNHFKLFDYPQPTIVPQQWTEGDDNVSDYLIIRNFGIETGRTNWHDGLVYVAFLSFEHFLQVPVAEQFTIAPKIRAEIQRFLTPPSGTESANVVTPSLTYTQDEHYTESQPHPAEPNAESKRLFMDNGGLTHHIYLDGDGDRYHATAAEEAEWRKELLENYTQRIQEEDNGATLSHIARNMQYNGAKNVEELLIARVKDAPPKLKQGLAQALLEVFNSDEGAQILISLLEYEEQDSYWRNYVFNSFFRARKNKAVQDFLIQCLRGDREMWFKKAVDVLGAWGAFGEKALNDRALIHALNWEDATAADPEFNQALAQVVSIIAKE